MTDTELKLFKLKDEIYLLNWHLDYEEHPTKYSLPKTSEKRQQNIEELKIRLTKKQNKLQQLETSNLKLETTLS